MTTTEKLNLFPSRANYVFIKQRMASAQKGLVLLKRKRDALELKLREYKAELAKQQDKTDKSVRAAIFSIARLDYLGTDLKPYTMSPVTRPDVYLRFSFIKSIGVTIPQFEICLQDPRSFPFTGLSRGGTEVPRVRNKFQEALAKITDMASIDYAVKVLEKGVHQNNMRLNGLEFVVVPRYQNTLNYIRDEMDEFEREDFYRLKRSRAKRIKQVEEEIWAMRHKLDDRENYEEKTKREREKKHRNLIDWQHIFKKNLEVSRGFKKGIVNEATEGEEDENALLDAEEYEELEFEDFEFEEEGQLDDDDNDDNDDNDDIEWGSKFKHEPKTISETQPEKTSFVIRDPDSGESTQEFMEKTLIINPPTLHENNYESDREYSENRMSSILNDFTNLEQQRSKSTDVQESETNKNEVRERVSDNSNESENESTTSEAKKSKLSEKKIE